jgi:glycosyltransferase involved in cell wall biosynthesis
MYVQNIGRQLTKMGHTVSVICASMGDNSLFFNDGLIKVYPIMSTQPCKLIYYISRLSIVKAFSGLLFYLHNGIKIHMFLLKLDRKIKIDYVEYTEGGDFWNSITNRFKYSCHLHGSFFTFKKQSGQRIYPVDCIRRRVEHFFIMRAKNVISPCKAMVELVETEIGKKFKNAYIIPYPVDTRQIKPVRNKTKLNKVTIFFASRNDPLKGGDLLIHILELLTPKIQSKIKVKFYGYVPYQDLSHLPFLHINKFVPKADLEIAYQDADICVIPSLFDNSPNTVYEAMAHGKIVVASSVGGIPEIIGDKENGFLFNPTDIHDFTEKLKNAINIVFNGDSYKIKMG